MSSSFEKSVKGATKIKLAPPKSKYIEHILNGTHSGEASVGEIFRTLQFRLRDSTWTIAFKALIVIHLMIREGAPGVTLSYLSQDTKAMIGTSTYSDIQTQGRNIRRYANYITARAKAYAKTKNDYVGGAEDRLRRLTVDKGLLRETEVVQDQIHALVQCDLFDDDPENEITLTAFRMLIMDLLTLFQVMNEGLINILQRYFEMSKPDAERALNIYKRFSKQTELVVKYCSMARHFEHSTRLEIPKLKHAPTSLTTNLEEYLHDNDFEINRRQYLAQKESKRTGKPMASPLTNANDSKATSKTPFPEAAPSKSSTQPQPLKGPSGDLIDFFDSLDQPQQMNVQSQSGFQQPGYPAQPSNFPQQTGFGPQQNGFVTAQSTNPFDQYNQQPQHQPPQIQQQSFSPHFQMPQQQFPQQPQTQQHFQPSLQSQPTGAGFGGYTPQPQPQPAQQNFPQQTSFSDPVFSQGFQQQSPMQTQSQTGFNQFPQTQQQSQLTRQQTNPFRTNTMPQQQIGGMSNTFTGSPSPMQSTTTGGGNPSSFGMQQSGMQAQTQSNGSSFSNSPFQSPPPPIPQQPQQSLTPQRTGTNPFAQPSTQPQQSQQGSVVSHSTGSTNPFRQSTFVNQSTGQGWQNSGQQGTMGGLEGLNTVPVFPRPGQGGGNDGQQGQTGGWY